MISHVMVGTNDIERAKVFYDAVLGVLGAGEPMRNVDNNGHVRLFYIHEDGAFGVTRPVDGEPAHPANGGTIAFRCGSLEQVQAFHDAAVINGGTSIQDAPLPGGGSVGSIKAYVRDPDGNKLCAICKPAA